MRKRIAVIGICSLGLLAIGSAPRYLEELRIGGGYGEGVDGGADFDKAGNIAADGSVKATGGIEAGKDSSVRGLVTAWDGAGGNAPGTLKLGSANGNVGYLFLSNDLAGLRLHSSLPSSDTDGDWLKAKTVTDLSAPPAIGATTPSTGRFTSVDVTGRARTGGPILAGNVSIAPAARLHVYNGSSGFTGDRNYRIAQGGLFENSDDAILLLQGGANKSTELWFGDSDSETAGRVAYSHATDIMSFYVHGAPQLTLNQYGDIGLTGDLLANGGEIIAGLTGEMRGVITACHGTSTNTAGVLKLVAANGSAHYYYAASDGTLRSFAGLPSSDSDGVAVGAQFNSSIATFTANDNTPSVSDGTVFRVPNTWTAGNNVTMLDGGSAGQQIVVIGGDSDCVFVDGTHLKLAGNWTAASGKTLSLVFDGTDWCETARADN